KMSSIRSLLLILGIGILLSCADHANDSWKNDMDRITELHCRAIQLRNARFTLADSMRFYQDSLLEIAGADDTKAQYWKSSLTVMEKRKTRLAETSRNLSDTIRAELIKLTGEMSVDEKRIFSDSLQARSEEHTSEL